MPQHYTPINFKAKLAAFHTRWAPKIIAAMNDYHFKLAKIEGEFVWHTHAETDEVFIVLGGRMKIALQDGEVALESGELFVVPAGVAHKPSADTECHILMVEPAGLVNTGDGPAGELTATTGEWI
ncbi:MAG: cupin domain-containing protein [Desulfosarcinaceae bacterium]|nr:cupin domain-containing protein [Desulfosarcinaceae bacterium]